MNFYLLAGALLTFSVSFSIPSRTALILSAADNDASYAALFNGFSLSVQSLISATTAPVLGSLADSTGRVPVLLFSVMFECIGLFLLAVFSDSLPGQFFCCLLTSISGSAGLTILAAVSDLAKDRRTETRTFARYSATQGIAIALGPFIGGAFAAITFTAAPILVSAVILLSCLLLFAHLPDTAGSDLLSARKSLWFSLQKTRCKVDGPLPTIKRSLSETRALTILAVGLLVESLAVNGLVSITFLYLNTKFGFGSFRFGVYVSLTGAVLIMSQLALSARMVRWAGERYVIVCGFIFCAIQCLTLGHAKKTWVLWPSILLLIPYFAAIPSLKAVVARQVDTDKQGQLQGSIEAIQSVVKPLASLGLASAFAISNRYDMPEFVFYPIAFCMLAAGVITNVALNHPEIK